MENPQAGINKGPYTGMSPRERLFKAGLAGQYKSAGRLGDRETMIRLLTSVDLTPHEAARTVEDELRRPGYYFGLLWPGDNPGEATNYGPYASMTINERLDTAGLCDEWSAARRCGDRETMISLLISVDIPPRQAEWTVDEMLSRPKDFLGPWKPPEPEEKLILWPKLLLWSALLAALLTLLIWLALEH